MSLALGVATTAFGQSAPSITTQPTSQTIAATSNAVFSVTATGQSPLTYQWSKNGANLSDSGHIVGATNSVLTVTSVAVADAGSYGCVVANHHGTVTSSTATLTVALPPVISTIANQTMFPNGAARTLAFTVTDPQNAAVTVNANSSSQSILPDSNLSVSLAGTNAALTITPSSGRGTVAVTLTARNSSGAVSQSNFNITFADFTLVPSSFSNLAYGVVVKWVDYDNDGKLDVFLSGEDTNFTAHTLLYHNNGNGSFTLVATTLPNLDDVSVDFADFDNDGNVDLAIAGFDNTNNFVQIYRNLGNGQFNLVTNLPQVLGASVAWGDYNNDGKPDLLVGGELSNGTPYGSVFRNNGDGTFTETVSGLTGGYFGAATWADFDGDGYPDILLSGGVGTNIETHLYVNTRTGFFGTLGAPFPWPGMQSGAVAWGDYNGDGQADFLISGTTGQGGYMTTLFRNGGTFHFDDSLVPLPALANSVAVWGDFDNDGKLDLFLAGQNSNYFAGVFRNLGTDSASGFTNVGTTLPGNYVRAAACGDYDNDGKLDLICLGLNLATGRSQMELFHNEGALPNTPPTAPSGLQAFVTNSTAVLVWNAATDAEQFGALSYNLRVGITPGGGEIFSAMADASTGFRRVPQIGNMRYRLTQTLKNLTNGTYYWSVQAIDNSFAGGAFAAEQSFQINMPTSKSQLMNLDFGTGTQSQEVGIAAVGQTPADVWNFYTRDDGSGGWLTYSLLTNIVWADGSPSPMSVEVINAAGAWTNASSDPMFNTYVYPLSGGSPPTVTVNVASVPLGNYDIYVYGHENSNVRELYSLAVDGNIIAKLTNAAAGWNSTNWVEGAQYVLFRGVQITNFPQTVTVYAQPYDVNASGVIAGLQIASQPLAPAIWKQPTNVLVGVGTNAVFSATPVGSQPFTNQWFFNGTPLVDDGRIIGAKTASLTISHTQISDIGSYSLAVTNVVGSTTSSTATLTLGFPPTIVQSPVDTSVLVGNTATFSASASGDAPLSYRWLFDDGPLSDDGHHTGTGTPNLVITNVVEADGGNYTVFVRNAFGSVYSSIGVLRVLVPPIVSLSPSTIYAPTGTNLVLTVSEGGTEPFTNQWYHDGVAMADGGNISGVRARSLTIFNVQAGDAGSYYVNVSNEAGTTNSGVTQVFVGDPPVITQQPNSQTAVAGDSVTFNSDGTGTQPISYSWYRNTTLLVDDAWHVGTTTPTLLVTNITTGDAGSYTVIWTNNFGMTTSAVATLTVLTRPGIVSQPLGRSVPAGLPTAFSVTASGSTPLGYQWQLNGADIVGATASTYTVASVDSNAIGSYTVVITNSVGSTTTSPALLTFGPVVGWGNNFYNQCLPPPGISNIVGIGGSVNTSYILGADGSLTRWRVSTNIAPATSNIVAISISTAESGIALTSDGTAVGIARSVPASWTNMVAVAAGPSISYGIRSDGTLVSTAQIPPGLFNITAVAAGQNQVMALRNDGTAVAWLAGSGSTYITPPVPLTNIVAIDTGYNCEFALTADGHIIAWGANSLTNVPPAATNVVAISVSDYGTSPTGFAVALRRDGTIVSWGTTLSATNVVDPSTITNAVAVHTSGMHALALVNNGAPQLIRPPVGGTAFSGNDFTLSAVAVGPNLNYQWSLNGVAIADATNAALTLTNMQQTDAGSYQLTVTNDFGSVTSLAVPVRVNDSAPFVTTQPVTVSQYAYVGTRYTFGVPISGSTPMSMQWRKGFGLNATNVPGATNQFLVLDPVNTTDGGSYSVIVSNAFGTYTSVPTPLTVRQVVAWGDNTFGKTNVPVSLTNAIAVSGGGYYNFVALRDDGSVLAWGGLGTSNAPANLTNIVEICGNPSSSSTIFGLRADGTLRGTSLTSNMVVALGTLSNIVDLEVDTTSATFLNSDGTLSRLIGSPATIAASMSNNFAGVSNVIALSPWDDGFQALRADGTVFSYGTGGLVPLVTNVVSVASSRYAGTFLKRDQTVVDFGHYPPGLPLTNGFLAIASSASGTELGVRTDGPIYTWGAIGVATNVPPGLPKLRMIDGGYNGFIALCTVPDFDPVFLNTALNTSNIVVSSRNSAQWYAQHDVTHDGQAVRSAAIGRNTASSMRTLITNGPTMVSFWWKVSSETNHDFLTFSIGGVPQAAISGEVDWQLVTFFVPAGSQMLTWTYSKDASGTAGLDAGFVDQLNIGAQAPYIFAQPQSQTVLGGSTPKFTVGAIGQAPLTYHWFRNTDRIGFNTNFVTLGTVSRNTQSGPYFVVISNLLGSVTSSNATLTVHTPQEIAVPLLQPDGTFLVTSRDSDNTSFSSQTSLAGFQAQYSSNLVDWLPVNSALSISNGYIQFIDVDATNDPMRFYRIIESW